LYASLLGPNPCQLKADNEDELLCNRLTVYVQIFFQSHSGTLAGYSQNARQEPKSIEANTKKHTKTSASATRTSCDQKGFDKK